MAREAYEALRFQGYADEDIYYLSRTTTRGVDGLAVWDHVAWACTAWAQDQTPDFLVYLVGPGQAGAFEINRTEQVLASELDREYGSLSHG